MLLISRTCATGTLYFAFLAITVASHALAKDEQNQNNQQNQDPKQAQPAAAAPSQPQAQTEQQQSGTDQINQQSNQQDVSRDAQRNASSNTDIQLSAPSNTKNQPAADQQQAAGDQPASIGSSNQRSNRDWRPDRARTDSQRNERFSTEQQQSGRQQGASLGVNIITSGDGIVVTRVQPGTPAQQMGLRPRDRIISINGQPARSADEFISTIRDMNPGDQVELGIARDNGGRTIRGQLEAYNEAIARNPDSSGNDEFRQYQGIMNRGRSNSDQLSSIDASPEAQQSRQLFNDSERSATRQTSFEDRGPSDRPASGDIDARLSRIEQQIDRLTQNVEEIRNTLGSSAPTSGLREAASAELRANTPRTQRPAANVALPNGETVRKNDRWNSENRFEQGDLPGARERAAQEAARRRAEQTGARLQQDARRDTQRSALPNTGLQQNPPDPAAQPPGQPATELPPGDQSQK